MKPSATKPDLDTFMHDAAVDIDDLREQAARRARAYATGALKAYSLEHPSRVCKLQVGGGYCTLHVSTTSAMVPFEEYIFGMGHQFVVQDKVLQPPEFLAALRRWGQDLHFPHDDWFSDEPMVLVFIAGEKQ